MPTIKFICWSGLSLLIGGALYAINGFFYLNNNGPQVMGSPRWLPVQIIITIFYALDIFGLMGLYSYQKTRAGLLGRIGIALAIIGSILAFVLSIAFVIPASTVQPAGPQSPSELIRSTGHLAGIRILVWAWIIAFIPGHIVTGISVIRAGVLPRRAGILVIMGMVSLLLGTASAQLFWLLTIGGVLSGIGLAWLGFALFSTQEAA